MSSIVQVEVHHTPELSLF